MVALAACHFCGKVLDKSAVKRCGRCKIACYCSQDCQASDWKIGQPPMPPHKSTCQKGAESLQDETTALVEGGIEFKECVEQFKKRVPQSAAVLGAIKNAFSRHSDPDDEFQLEGCEPVPQPQGPPQPPPMVILMMSLGAQISPTTAPAPWLVMPGFLNTILHDRITDVSQSFLRYKQKKAELEDSNLDLLAKENILNPLKQECGQDLGSQMYGALLLGIIIKVGVTFTMVHNGQPAPEVYRKQGFHAMKRFIWLINDEETRLMLGWPLLRAFRDVVQSPPPTRYPFFESGGIECALKNFKAPRLRLLCLGCLASLNGELLVKYGSVSLIAAALEELLVPGLLDSTMDDFLYIYSDLPETKLGIPHRNGGTARSSQNSTGDYSTGMGFAPFGVSLLRKVVESENLIRKSGAKSGFIFSEALQLLTKDGEARSIAALFFVCEQLGIPAGGATAEKDEKEDDGAGEEGKKKTGGGLADLKLPAEKVLQAFDDWNQMSYAEKKPYYFRSYSPADQNFLTQAGVYD